MKGCGLGSLIRKKRAVGSGKELQTLFLLMIKIGNLVNPTIRMGKKTAQSKTNMESGKTYLAKRRRPLCVRNLQLKFQSFTEYNQLFTMGPLTLPDTIKGQFTLRMQAGRIANLTKLQFACGIIIIWGPCSSLNFPFNR